MHQLSSLRLVILLSTRTASNSVPFNLLTSNPFPPVFVRVTGYESLRKPIASSYPHLQLLSLVCSSSFYSFILVTYAGSVQVRRPLTFCCLMPCLHNPDAEGWHYFLIFHPVLTWLCLSRLNEVEEDSLAPRRSYALPHTNNNFVINSGI